MAYLDTLGELILIFSLLAFVINVNKSSSFESPFRPLLTMALLFIVITASFGAARFAGINQIVPAHDFLSLISAKFAMVIYVFSLPMVMLSYARSRSSYSAIGDAESSSNLSTRKELANGQLSKQGVVKIAKGAMIFLLTFNFLTISFSIETNKLITDVSIVVGFVLFSLVAKEKGLVYLSIVTLLLVPASTALHISDDLSMAIFHLLLAAHFLLINRVFTLEQAQPSFNEVGEQNRL
ncbi:hypothetical protein N9L48_05790 [Psychrosphaera sp.]|nr:hypothetical protein [Psychrosphaera sp.]